MKNDHIILIAGVLAVYLLTRPKQQIIGENATAASPTTQATNAVNNAVNAGKLTPVQGSAMINNMLAGGSAPADVLSVAASL